MPFEETHVVDERRRFVIEAQRSLKSFSEICRRYGTSRPTGYKWPERWEGEGRIWPETIEPASPHQNGKHERMHRTLKREATRPAQGNLSAQQRHFNRFQEVFNTVRPHEALDDETPASVFESSARTYPERLPPSEYPGHFEVRRVSTNGGIRWNNRWINIGTAFGTEYIGLEEDLFAIIDINGTAGRNPIC